MQKRRVGRLVVSWNWGRGLGIVTQTSLLRVFDPMEMYGVIENLQQTIQQLESERSPSPPSASGLITSVVKIRDLRFDNVPFGRTQFAPTLWTKSVTVGAQGTCALRSLRFADHPK
jgi:hypothetical protein